MFSGSLIFPVIMNFVLLLGSDRYIGWKGHRHLLLTLAHMVKSFTMLECYAVAIKWHA